jgi:hypothetical protein
MELQRNLGLTAGAGGHAAVLKDTLTVTENLRLARGWPRVPVVQTRRMVETAAHLADLPLTVYLMHLPAQS